MRFRRSNKVEAAVVCYDGKRPPVILFATSPLLPPVHLEGCRLLPKLHSSHVRDVQPSTLHAPPPPPTDPCQKSTAQNAAWRVHHLCAERVQQEAESAVLPLELFVPVADEQRAFHLCALPRMAHVFPARTGQGVSTAGTAPRPQPRRAWRAVARGLRGAPAAGSGAAQRQALRAGGVGGYTSRRRGAPAPRAPAAGRRRRRRCSGAPRSGAHWRSPGAQQQALHTRAQLCASPPLVPWPHVCPRSLRDCPRL